MVAVAELSGLVSNLGFPIAVTVMMFRQYQKEREYRREERDEWQNALEEQTDVLRSMQKAVASQ